MVNGGVTKYKGKKTYPETVKEILKLAPWLNDTRIPSKLNKMYSHFTKDKDEFKLRILHAIITSITQDSPYVTSDEIFSNFLISKNKSKAKIKKEIYQMLKDKYSYSGEAKTRIKTLLTTINRLNLDLEVPEMITKHLPLEKKERTTEEYINEFIDYFIPRFVKEHENDFKEFCKSYGIKTQGLTYNELNKLKKQWTVVFLLYNTIRYGGMWDILYLYPSDKNKYGLDREVLPREMMKLLSGKGRRINNVKVYGYGDCDEFARFYAALVNYIDRKYDLNINPKIRLIGEKASHAGVTINIDKMRFLLDLSLAGVERVHDKMLITDGNTGIKVTKSMIRYENNVNKQARDDSFLKVKIPWNRQIALWESTDKYYSLSLPLFELLKEYKRLKNYKLGPKNEIDIAGHSYTISYSFNMYHPIWNESYTFLFYPIANRKGYILKKYNLKQSDAELLTKYIIFRLTRTHKINKDKEGELKNKMMNFLTSKKYNISDKIAFYSIILTNPKLMYDFDNTLTRLGELRDSWDKYDIRLFDFLLAMGPLTQIPLPKDSDIIDELSPDNIHFLSMYILKKQIESIDAYAGFGTNERFHIRYKPTKLDVEIFERLTRVYDKINDVIRQKLSIESEE
ncbi:hypothetical protein J7J26_01150 [Candidatus Micrarchaeota archaeon]|nr:hypothetical protein [Candidatus Micrarchaeota archaeon]